MEFKPRHASEVEEWWRADRIPPEVVNKAGALREGGKGYAKGKAPAGPDPQRAQGVGQPTGRQPLPSGRGAGKGKGGGEDDPRRRQPGAADGRGEVGGRGREEMETQKGALQEEEGNEGEWKSVWKGGSRSGGKGRGKAGQDDREITGKGEEQEQGGDDRKDQQRDMPPERTFEMPHAPRQMLAQLTEREEKRIERLRQEGVSEQKLQRAEKRREDLEQQLRAAGGRTTQSLGYQIRREEDNRSKAIAAVERIDLENASLQGEIDALQAKIDDNGSLQGRYRQRQEAAEARLAFLATQKAKESLPNPFLENIRGAAEIVSRSTDAALQPLKELLWILVGNPQQHFLGEDSSSAGEEAASNATEELLGRTGEEEEEGYDAFEDEQRTEIAYARQRVSELQRQYRGALEDALQASKQQPTKRRLGEDGAKEEKDTEMQKNEETEGLTPEQVVDFFRQRLKEGEEELRSLERASAKEIVPVEAKPETKEAQVQQQHQQHEQQQQQQQRQQQQQQQQQQRQQQRQQQHQHLASEGNTH